MLPPFFARLPDELAADYLPAAPWELLGEPLDRALAEPVATAIEIRLGPEIHLLGDRITIGKGTRIGPGVTIQGPVHIGRDVEIRSGAYLHSGSWIGDGAVVGAATEIKHSILFAGARAPHLNYVGDSILGSGVNLGAGTILSNFRHDGREVSIPLEDGRLATGRRKLGAILGDGAKTGCNCVLHPGALVGSGTSIYPGVQLRAGVYRENRIIKLRQELIEIERQDG